MDKDTINKYLTRWGKTLQGDPIMRLVWSDEMLELRFGTFNDYHGSIFLRQFTGVREVPKYPWVKSRWVLERWYPPNIAYNPELPESVKGSYEPVYVFQDRHDKALPLSLRVVELICEHMFNCPPDKESIKEGHEQEEARRDKAETNYLEDGLEMSVISNQLHQGEAVVMPQKENND